MNATYETVQPIEKPNIGSWLFNPFTYIAGGKALMLGVAAILASGWLGAMSGFVFDGTLDFHSFPNWKLGTTWKIDCLILFGIINWLSLCLPLWIAGKLLSKSKFRTIDLLGTQAMARWPYLIAPLAVFLPGFEEHAKFLMWQLSHQGPAPAAHPISFFAGLIIILISLGWMVYLMYRAFSITCNLRGAKAGIGFTASLFVAEVLSKFCYIALNNFLTLWA